MPSPHPRRAAPQTPSTDTYRVGYGQRECLRRVHTDVREATVTAAVMSARFSPTTAALRTTPTSSPLPRLDANDARHRRSPARANANQTPLRRVRYRDDQEWVLIANPAWGFSADVCHTACQRSSATATEHLPLAVQRFPEAPDRTPTQQDYEAPGDMYSRHFYRRSVPPTPPMNGFAQLAAYLRSLDSDPTLVERSRLFRLVACGAHGGVR